MLVGTLAQSISGIGFALVCGPLLVAALLATHGSGFSLKALADIAVELLLPFGLGQALRPWVGPWITRQKHVLSYVDRGSILLVVYSAFSESVVAGVWTHMDPWSLVLVFALDAALLGVVLGLAIGGLMVVLAGGRIDLGGGMPWAVIVVAITLGVAVAMLAAAYPARIASRLSIVRAVHFE